MSMICTPAEIERKRQEALKKLANKRTRSGGNINSNLERHFSAEVERQREGTIKNLDDENKTPKFQIREDQSKYVTSNSNIDNTKPTPLAEIERKRQEALKKLADKNKSPLKISNNANITVNSIDQHISSVVDVQIDRRKHEALKRLSDIGKSPVKSSSLTEGNTAADSPLSFAEIERKRQEALKRLAEKNKSPLKISINGNIAIDSIVDGISPVVEAKIDERRQEPLKKYSDIGKSPVKSSALTKGNTAADFQLPFAEIERKRQEALKRLADKNKSPLKICNSGNITGNSIAECMPSVVDAEIHKRRQDPPRKFSDISESPMKSSTLTEGNSSANSPAPFAEIERRRQEALKRLADKKKSPLKINENVTTNTNFHQNASVLNAEIERKRQEALKRLSDKGKLQLECPLTTNENSSTISNFTKTTSIPGPSHKIETISTNNNARSNTSCQFNVKLIDEIERNRQEALKRRAEKNNPPDKIGLKLQEALKKLGPTIWDPQKFMNKASSTIEFNCVLQNETSFCLEICGYINPNSVKTAEVNFDIKEYENVILRLKPLKSQVEEIPKFVLNCFKTPKTDLSMIDINAVEPELRNSLMPFQREGVAFGIDKGGRCLIADDMGLGKTFQALGIASYYRHDWPLLIVTTASMKNTWEQTIIEQIPSVPLMQLQYMVSARDYIDEARVLIVSHDMLARVTQKLADRRFGVVIFDESHTFKNFKAKGTQAAKKIADMAKRVILLSGTPALSRPSELFSQLSFIDRKFFTFMEFSKRYCDGKPTKFGWDASGQSNLQELELLLTRRFMIRRTKDQVLATMPNKSQEIISLDMKLNQLSHEDRKCLETLEQRFISNKGPSKHNALMAFFSESARIKMPSVLSYLLHVLEENKKFLVFAHHKIMLDAVDQFLTRKGKKFIRIDGNTTGSQRKLFMDQFQTGDDYICAVLSITAANAGITLTAAELVIFAELHWNPSILSQAESRAHRIGQIKPVTVRYLLASGTADHAIWPMLERKQRILMEAGLCKDNFNNVVRKNQPVSSEYVTTEFNTLDISSYLEPPTKKQKINDSVVSDLNDSLLEECLDISQVLNMCNTQEDSKCVDVDNMLNDGLDDVLSTIDI